MSYTDINCILGVSISFFLSGHSKGSWDSSDAAFKCLGNEISCKLLRARMDPHSFAKRFPSLSKWEQQLDVNKLKKKKKEPK